MTPKHLCVLLLAVVAFGTVAGQWENDNQFPPEKPSEADEKLIEGSGDGTIEDPLLTNVASTPIPQLEEVQARILNNDVTTASELTNAESTPTPQLFDIQATILNNDVITTSEQPKPSCPSACVCNIEGDTDNFIVDCSGCGLSEFPSPLDPKTTTLKVQNNNLTEIPKDVSALKNLKVLNAAKNSIKKLADGSVSELAELTVLVLADNRLIEYPQDLKNGFSLKKLKELDLGGNDMRTTLTSVNFEIFESLRSLTLPTTTPELVEDLCRSKSLVTVCTGSCTSQLFECPNAATDNEEGFIPVGAGGLLHDNDEVSDPDIKPVIDIEISNSGTDDKPKEQTTSSGSTDTSVSTAEPPASNVNTSNAASGRSAAVKPNSILVEAPTEKSVNKTESDVKLGATTSEAKTGGVDKSVIGFIVAGMVVVVAGITIKKNWSSIRRRFGSTPRAASDRAGVNTNGTAAPEEVPLQEKSPV